MANSSPCFLNSDLYRSDHINIFIWSISHLRTGQKPGIYCDAILAFTMNTDMIMLLWMRTYRPWKIWCSHIYTASIIATFFLINLVT
jgi:hypothetical protein